MIFQDGTLFGKSYSQVQSHLQTHVSTGNSKTISRTSNNIQGESHRRFMQRVKQPMLKNISRSSRVELMMISVRGSYHQNNEFTNAMCTISDNSGKKILLLADRSSFNVLARTKKKELILRTLVSLNPQIPIIYSRLVKMINSYLFNPQSQESLDSEAILSLKTFLGIFNVWIQINHRGSPRSPV